MKALIVMPEEASPFKKEAARAYGAQVVDQGVTVENREEVARALLLETGYAFIHPFDDPLVMMRKLWHLARGGTSFPGKEE